MSILYILIILQVFCFLMLIRNSLVYKWRCKAIDAIYEYQMHIIETDSKHHTSSMWELYENPGYNTMMFMISCWSYKSFYSDLQQRMEAVTTSVSNNGDSNVGISN